MQRNKRTHTQPPARNQHAAREHRHQYNQLNANIYSDTRHTCNTTRHTRIRNCTLHAPSQIPYTITRTITSTTKHTSIQAPTHARAHKQIRTYANHTQPKRTHDHNTNAYAAPKRMRTHKQQHTHQHVITRSNQFQQSQ